MVGFVEVIILLLGLAGFGLSPNPKASTADQAMQYAMPDADVVAHVDVTSIVPGNYKLLVALPNNPQIKASPDLHKMVQRAVNEIEGLRGIAKSSTGIDLATDITDATLFVKFTAANKDPDFVATVRGKLSMRVLDNIAALTKQQVQKVGGGALIEMGQNDPAIGITKDNVLIAGSPKLVRDRLADTWKAPARAAGTNLGWAQDAINAKPVFTLAVSASQTTRGIIAKEFGPKKNFLSDLAARHKAFSFSVFHDGIGWTWIDQNKAGMDQIAMMSEGAIELLRASQIAPRGFAKILLGGIDSYKGTNKQIDEVIRRKADLMKIVENLTGDGNFKVAVNKDAAKSRLDVRATGKSLSEVVPAGAMIPAGFLMFLTMRSSGSTMMTPIAPKPPVITPRPVPKKAPAPPVKQP